jgi:hypothetical protein
MRERSAARALVRIAAPLSRVFEPFYRLEEPAGRAAAWDWACAMTDIARRPQFREPFLAHWRIV